MAKKDTYYFPHDYSANNNPKISAMIGEFKATGYGLYWFIIELLHQDDEHKLPLKKYIYSAISKEMGVTADEVVKFINNCVNDYELFYSDDEYFWADRVNKNIETRKEIREKRSFAGQKSAEKRAEKSNTCSTRDEQTLTHVEQSSTKERKGKEKERKKEYKPPLEKSGSIDFDTFILKFNSFGKRNFRVTDKVKNALKARLKDYKKTEIIQAIENAHKDLFHIENNFKYLTPEFILRPDKLEKFLNSNPITQQPKGYTPQLTN